MTSIDILCANGTNGTPYAEYFKRSAELLSTSGSRFRWKCILGGDRNNEYIPPEGFENFGRGSNATHASVNHAESMQQLLKQASADITIIADIDIALLKMSWDEVVLNYLDKYDCFGISWGEWDRKYLGFPSIMFIAFRTKLLKTLPWDLKPVIIAGSESPERYTVTNHDSNICGVPSNSVLKKDTGWRLPYIFKENGKTGYAATKVKVGSKLAQLPFENKKQRLFCLEKDTHMSEYVLDGELFATHLQACRSKPFNGKNAKVWRWRINKYLTDKYRVHLE